VTARRPLGSGATPTGDGNGGFVNRVDDETITPDEIEGALYANAQGDHALNATTYMLTQEGSYLLRTDLHRPTLGWSDDRTMAYVRWSDLRKLIDGDDCPYLHSSLHTILTVCCALHDGGPSRLNKLSGLDSSNARIVARGIHLATGHMKLYDALGRGWE
jgi:hypothetical protein